MRFGDFLIFIGVFLFLFSLLYPALTVDSEQEIDKLEQELKETQEDREDLIYTNQELEQENSELEHQLEDGVDADNIVLAFCVEGEEEYFRLHELDGLISIDYNYDKSAVVYSLSFSDISNLDEDTFAGYYDNEDEFMDELFEEGTELEDWMCETGGSP